MEVYRLFGGIAGWSPYEGSPIYYDFSSDSILTIIKEDTTNFSTEFKIIEVKSMEWDTIQFLQSDNVLAEYELFYLKGDILKMRLPENHPDYWDQIIYFKRINGITNFTEDIF